MKGESLTSISISPLSSTAKSEAKDQNEKKLKICRFLVQNIQGKGGNTPSDYIIDLSASHHGLFHLVLSVFRILREHSLTEDCYYSHLWSFQFDGSTFQYGWRDHSSNSIHHLDEKDVRILADLKEPLKEGQKGIFSGESAKFNIVLKKIHTKDNAFSESFPKVMPVCNNFSANLLDDFMNDQLKSCAIKLRDEFAAYFNGNNEWRRNRKGGETWILKQPIAKIWSYEECKIMRILLDCNCKFKKAWSNIMMYAFPDRPEAGTSVKWYQLKKEGCLFSNDGKGGIVLAKRLALTSLEAALEKGVPKVGRNPDAKSEDILRKRGIITENMTSFEKRQKVLYFREFCDSDESDSSDFGINAF